MITGSPGGNSIPAYVSKTILGVFDWGLSAQQAVDLPNIVARGEKVKIESYCIFNEVSNNQEKFDTLEIFVR